MLGGACSCFTSRVMRAILTDYLSLEHQSHHTMDRALDDIIGARPVCARCRDLFEQIDRMMLTCSSSALDLHPAVTPNDLLHGSRQGHRVERNTPEMEFERSAIIFCLHFRLSTNVPRRCLLPPSIPCSSLRDPPLDLHLVQCVSMRQSPDHGGSK